MTRVVLGVSGGIAAYKSVELLRRANRSLETMRVLLRLSHRLKYLSHEGYEHAARSINQTGIQLGAWIKEREAR